MQRHLMGRGEYTTTQTLPKADHQGLLHLSKFDQVAASLLAILRGSSYTHVLFYNTLTYKEVPS